MKQVVGQVSEAVSSAPETSDPEVIYHALRILTQLKDRPTDLAEAAYGWCVVIWRNHHSYRRCGKLLCLSLEVGFRHLHRPGSRIPSTSTSAEHHQEIFDAVLKSNNTEAVIDLMWASVLIDKTGGLGLSICTDYVLNLCSAATESLPRELQKVFITCVGRTGLGAPEKVGKGRFVDLLNRLRIGIECLWYHRDTWAMVLLEIIRSPEDARNLTAQSWELLADLAAETRWLNHDPLNATYSPDVTASLLKTKEWDKLECWMGFAWMVWSPEAGNVVEGLGDTTKLLFQQRPGAVHKLTQWMERWRKMRSRNMPESFKQICDELAE